MTKQKWLFALLIGSSMGCFCDADWSSAQSLTNLNYRLQILPEQCTAEASCNAGGLSNPLSINNRDWVSGVIMPPNDVFDHPGLWRRATDSLFGNQSWRLTDLGTLGGPQAGVATSKNEIGWLAGPSDTAATDPYAENFCGWECSSSTGCPVFNHVCRGFLWRDDTKKMIELPPITSIRRCEAQHDGGCNSHATASNNNHQIAGYAENGVMEPGCAQAPGFAAQMFLYQGVVWGLNASGAPVIERTLPPVTGDAVSQAYGMNDAGIVVGASGPCLPPNIAPPSPQVLRAVLWSDAGRPVDLGTLGGHQAIAYGINEKGQVVGQSSLPGDAVVHMFFWQEGAGMKDVGTLLPDDTGVGLVSINNRGEMVGWSCGPSETETPFICGPLYWREGMKQPIDLNQVTQSPHLGICCASDINDSGEIVVAVFDPSYNGGDIRAAVLVPTQDEQGPGQNPQGQSAAAVQRFVLPSNTLQRLNAHLRGLKITR
jgi:probable HAF family extracellular repeat protein